jgi:hypothetical protein
MKVADQTHRVLKVQRNNIASIVPSDTESVRKDGFSSKGRTIKLESLAETSTCSADHYVPCNEQSSASSPGDTPRYADSSGAGDIVHERGGRCQIIIARVP